MQVPNHVPGWVPNEHDGQVAFVSEGGERAGWIVCTPGDGPLLPPVRIVAAALPERPGLERTGPAAFERVVTEEGEYGWVAAVPCQAAGEPARLSLGVVLGDDGYLRVLGTSLDPEA